MLEHSDTFRVGHVLIQHFLNALTCGFHFLKRVIVTFHWKGTGTQTLKTVCTSRTSARLYHQTSENNYPSKMSRCVPWKFGSFLAPRRMLLTAWPAPPTKPFCPIPRCLHFLDLLPLILKEERRTTFVIKLWTTEAELGKQSAVQFCDLNDPGRWILSSNWLTDFESESGTRISSIQVAKSNVFQISSHFLATKQQNALSSSVWSLCHNPPLN